jgi:hypothetical protein
MTTSAWPGSSAVLTFVNTGRRGAICAAEAVSFAVTDPTDAFDSRSSETSSICLAREGLSCLMSAKSVSTAATPASRDGGRKR